jgi:signal transduction histidine kinase
LVERIAQGLRRSQASLREALGSLLRLVVDKQALFTALADLADRTQEEGKVVCTFECSEPVAVANDLTATHLYLIAQEAVHNSVKHAKARHVRITFKNLDGGLVLGVADDGIGMPSLPTEHQGLGLRIMRNRAAILGARLTIERAEPNGTLVTCVCQRI